MSPSRCIILAALSCVACSRDPAPAPSPTDAAAIALIDAAGDRALLTVVVRPEQLPRFVGALGPLPPDLHPELRAALTDPRAALDAAVGPLPGRDPERPVVAALFEPPSVAAPGALTPTLPDLTAADAPRPAIRHRVLLPATDPAALAAAIEARLVDDGARRDGDALVSPRLGAARIYPEGDRVRLELAPRGTPPVDWGVRGGPSARTPALAAAATARAPIAALVRPWLLRAVFTHQAAEQVVGALAVASPEFAAQLATKGAEIMLGGEVLMHAAPAELDDWAIVAMPTASGPELTITATVAPAGAAVLAKRGDHPPLTPTRAPEASAWIAGDVGAMLDAAGIPTALRDTSTQELQRAFAECGPGCALHALLRRPIGTLAALSRETPLAGLALRTPQLASFGVEPGPPGAAVAAQFASEATFEAARTPLEALARAVEMDELTTRRLVDGSTATIGALGFDPAKAFGEPMDDPALARFSVDRAVFEGRLPPELRAMLAPIKRIEGRLDHAGDALVAQLAVQMVVPPAPLETPPPVRREAAGPIASTPPSPASACMLRAAAGIKGALGAIEAADPARQVAVVATALGELRVDLSCAAADPALAPAVRGLRRLLLTPIMDDAVDGWSPEPALTLLQSLCDGRDVGDAALCARVEAARARPAIDLPGLAAARCAEALGDRSRLRVTATGADLGGAPLPSDAATRRELLSTAALLGPIQLGIEPSLPWVQVAPLIADLAAAGVESVHVVARFEQRVIGVPLRLRDAAPVADPRPGSDRFAAMLDKEAPRGPGVALRVGGNAAALPDGRPLLPVDIDPATLDRPLDLEPSDGVSWARIVEYVGAACPAVTLGASPAAAAPAQLAGDGPDLRPATLERDAIKAVIRGNQAAVRTCYSTALATDPKLAGTVRVRFQVAPSGTVLDVAAEADGFAAPAVVDCVKRAVGEMRFPAARNVSSVSYPFVFQPN